MLFWNAALLWHGVLLHDYGIIMDYSTGIIMGLQNKSRG